MSKPKNPTPEWFERERARSSRRSAAAKAARAAARETRPAPDGSELRTKFLSTLTGPDGGIRAEWHGQERSPDDPPHVDPMPPDHHVVSRSTMFDRQGQALVQWVRAEPDKVDRDRVWVQAMREAAADAVSNHPAYMIEPPAPEHVSDDWLAVYPWGDPHIGMLAHEPEAGQHHDLTIACRDFRTATDLLVASAPPAKTALFVNLGDYYHAQDDRQTTPGHGHKLDVDGRWYKVVRAGLQLKEYAIARMLTKHERVVDINVPGNHDPDVARMIAIYLEAVFRGNDRVEIRDNAAPYQIFEFGLNLILLAHGDGVKREGLPGLLAARWPLEWGRARYRRAYTGHIHHETEKEFPGMKVRSFGILPPKDAWHAWKGYDSEQTIEVIGHHRERGPCTRSVIDIHTIRAEQRK